MPTFYIKRNDLAKALEIELKVPAGATPPDATSKPVVFNMKNKATGAVKINRASATVVSATRLRYSWALGDTDTAGVFVGEFEINDGGKPDTWPNFAEGQLLIIIEEDIA